MTKMEFFGCGMIAFGLPLALFIWTIAQSPLRILVFITSAFFWLVSLLFSSIIWFAVVPLRDQLAFGLGFSVLIQELFRFLFFFLIWTADEGLHKVVDNDPNTESMMLINNKHLMAYVAGFGFAVISGAFSMVNLLAQMYGPATIGIKGDSENFFLASAFTTLCFILLHIFWSVIAFDGFHRRRYLQVAAVVASHVTISYLTLLNQYEGAYYIASILPAYVTMFVMGAIAFVIAGGSCSNLKALLCRRSSNSFNIH